MTLTQRSTEWRQLRAGNVTASKFADVLTDNNKKHKGRPIALWPWAPTWLSKTAANYLMEKLFELNTEQFLDRGATAAMKHGIVWEEQAREHGREYLREKYGQELILPEGKWAYVEHPTEPHIGCSPDGLVGDDGVIEFKCPWNGSRHVEAILNSDWLEHEHRAQTQGTLWILDRQWVDPGSFDPRFNTRKYHSVRVERDDMFIESELAPKVTRFRDLLLELFAKHFPQAPDPLEIPF